MLESEDIRLLTEVGFLASSNADIARAEAIFGILRELRKTSSFPYIGLAMAYLNAGKAEDAVRSLELAADVVASDVRPELDAFRGLALQMAGRLSESKKALASAGSHRLAQAMLGLRTAEIDGA